MKKTVKVIMLPTEKAGNIIKDSITTSGIRLLFNYNNVQSLRDYYTFQHLYLVSDDEIKEGDWFIGETNIVKQVNKISKTNAQIHTADGYAYFRHKSKKVIATTDNSINVHYPIKEIPESFITAYIKAFNEGKPITEVLVEYEVANCANIDVYNQCEGHKHTYKVKTREDNTVIIHQAKTYTRDEVIELLESFILDIDTSNLEIGNHVDIPDPKKWIQDNL